jgi:hypothetical protein
VKQQGGAAVALSGESAALVWSSLPGAALAVAAATGAIPESVALSLFAVSFVGLNLMHMGATWARVYVPAESHARPIERLWIPIALVAFAVSFEAIGGGALLLAVQYFLSFHHAIMQNYGLHRAAQRRSGRAVDARLDVAACVLLPGAALLYRAGMVCDVYSGALLPSVPIPVIAAMAVAGVLALAAFAQREWLAHQRGERVDPTSIGLLFGTNLTWSALLVFIPHPAIPLFALASGHYIQYLYFVWRAEQRTPAIAASMPLRHRVQSALRSDQVRYLIVLLAMGGTVTLLLTAISSGMRAAAVWMQWRPDTALDLAPWAAAMLGVNLEHYWLDSRIWRSPKRGLVPAIAWSGSSRLPIHPSA